MKIHVDTVAIFAPDNDGMTMKGSGFNIVFILLVLSSSPLFSQTVSIDKSTQRFLGPVSELDRGKYFTFHGSGSDPDVQVFCRDYNTTPGRGFWGPFAIAKKQNGEVGVYPPLQGGDGNVRSVKDGYIATEHPSNVYTTSVDAVAAGKWAADHYRNHANPPGYFEPMNEPFVHAKDFGTDHDNIRIHMAQIINEVGKSIHAAPELANMKVIGYGGAWPSFELWDFDHWNSRMKMFMDTAGANMDALSYHLYDGINVSGQDSKRSGSNSEAVMDLIEAYSFIKWGMVKDHAISEFGGIAKGYPDEYSDIKSIQSVRAINHILFNLLERENNMEVVIPFISEKAEWHLTAANNYQPYGAVLFRPTNLGEPVPDGWVYTPRIYFYDLWKEFKGKRINIRSDNNDIQTQAFVSDNKLYVAINNLDDAEHTLLLNHFDGLDGLQDVRIKRLKIYPEQVPVFTNDLLDDVPRSLTLIDGETVTLEYTFSDSIVFDNAIRSKKYYSEKYLQPINADSTIGFQINGVTTGAGKATLRMSIGRKHDVSKAPWVKINDSIVPVPGNWKGYDQSNRDDFFGTIEIPVPTNLLLTDNIIDITFPDSGGHLSSLILQVETFDTLSNGISMAYAPDTVLSEKDVEVKINYESEGPNGLTARVHSPSGTLLGQVQQSVDAGSGFVDFSISQEEPWEAGSGYSLSVVLHPPGGQGTLIDSVSWTFNVIEASLDLQSDSLFLLVGQKDTLDVITFPDNMLITMVSGNPGIAQVNAQKREVYAIYPGSTHIIASAGQSSRDTAYILVSAFINIVPDSIVIDPLMSLRIRVFTNPGSISPNWISTNPEVATISGGQLTALQAGNTDIIAYTTEYNRDTCRVIVTGDPNSNTRAAVREALRVYPNPSDGQLFFTQASMIESIEVINIQGQVLSQESGKESISIEHLAEGMYFLNLKTHGSRTFKYCIVKQ